MTTPTEARFMADLLETRRYRYQPTEDVRTSEEAVALALRSLADQVETLQGQALSSVEREEYFAMKKDAERYRFLNEALEKAIQDCLNHANGRQSEWGSRAETAFEFLEQAIDRAREAT